MGVIREAVNGLDSSDELLNSQKDSINILSDLAESKSELFRAEILESLRTSGTPENQALPIDSIIASEVFTHAYHSNNFSLIESTITDSFKDFMNGGTESILTGVGKILSGAAQTLLGVSSGSSKTYKSSFIVPENLSMIRVDVRLWCMDVSAQSIRSVVENVFAAATYKSIIDLTKIGYSTFLHYYQSQLDRTGMTGDELASHLEKAGQIYQLINSNTFNAAPTSSNGESVLTNFVPGTDNFY